MNDSSTCIGGNEVAWDNSEATVGLLLLEVVKERGVSFADKVFTLDLVKDLVVLDFALFDHILYS